MFKKITIDNFLYPSDYNHLKKLKLRKINDNEIKVYNNTVRNNKVTNNSCLDKKIVKRLHRNYHSKALKILKSLCPEKADLYNYSEFNIIETGLNYKFPIHDDNLNKLLSGVIYLSPKKNKGTIFYTSKYGKNKKTTRWKINRALFFSRQENKTWHSFEGDKKNNRLALVYNLMTDEKNLSKVCKIEKTNYFISFLRFKLNPYLYQYLKFII